jgi:hypothetical protein
MPESRRLCFTEVLCALGAIGCAPAGDASDRAGAAAQKGAPPAGFAQSPSSDSQWQISPGRFGPITSQTSERDLRQRFGAASLETTRISIGEGETAPGAVLFPGDSMRRAEIIWQDSVQRQRPARIVLRGARSQWHLAPGILLGTPLVELERLNGKPFTLAGFGWDFAGVVTDWKGGKLDPLLTGIKLYLDPGPAQEQSPAYARVLGDRDYSSSLPAMQQLNPRVWQVFVDFEGP